MTDYLIGTGGWAYFRVPGLRPLVAYSRLFDFVEVNSTFYQIPNLKTVQSWRRQVPPNFEFSVRCNKDVTHEYLLRPTQPAFKAFDKMVSVCQILRAEILHMQTPASFRPSRENAELFDAFLSSVNSSGVRIALEVRGSNQSLTSSFLGVMQDYNMVHSVDLSRDEEPAYQSDVLYSRLFGKGYHNVYQPTDQELKKVDKRASSRIYRKAMVSFHFVRMYKDAARLKIRRQTGKFPMVTKSTGLKSLEEVLDEDARFPSLKNELVQHQGWKLIDLTRDERVPAAELLEKLPQRTYQSVEDVVDALRNVV